jgi:ribonuclease E
METQNNFYPGEDETTGDDFDATYADDSSLDDSLEDSEIESETGPDDIIDTDADVEDDDDLLDDDDDLTDDIDEDEVDDSDTQSSL